MKKLFFVAGIALVFVGCVPITSKLNINPQTGTCVWSSPKDVKVDSIDAYTATNGIKHLVVKGWASSNNPQVINSAGAADAAIVNAVGTQVLNAVAVGSQMAATVGASQAVNAAVGAAKGAVSVTPTPAK